MYKNILYTKLIHYCTHEIQMQCTSCFLFGIIGRCWLSVHYCTSLKRNLSNPSPFSTDNLKLDRLPNKIKWKIHISSFKDAYIKSYTMQLPVLLFLVVLHQQILLLQLFRTSFNTIGRKILITNFPFLTE